MLEGKERSQPYRKAYRDGLKQLIAKRQEECRQARTCWMSPQRARDEQAYYRTELRKLLGWPLTQPWPDTAPEVKIGETVELENHHMMRLQVEVFPDMPYYGLLFVPKTVKNSLPLIVCQHGGHGTPELCSDLHGENNYSHVVQCLLRRDVIVFVPQMLLWSEDEEDKPHFPGYGLPYNRNQTDAAFRQLGGSLAAFEVFCLMRSLDALAKWPEVDGSRMAMLGLSYGGFYTQLVAALDTRILAAHTSAFFCERESFCWPDFAWKDAALYMQDAEICALIAPRTLTVEMGLRDNLFDYRKTQQEFQRLKPYYDAFDAAEQLHLAIVDTNHQFFEVDQIIDRLIKGMG